jgi:transposase
MKVWFHAGMKPLTIADAATMVLGLQDEIRRSEESRYDHRLHGVLLVAQGMTCPEVGRLLGEAPRSVEYWVRHLEERGLAGLVEGVRPGRPQRLRASQLQGVQAVLRRAPGEVGLSGTLWDGKTLQVWIARRYGVPLGVRQCQRMLRQRGFRLRKPRPLIAHADPELPKTHKKTPGIKR